MKKPAFAQELVAKHAKEEMEHVVVVAERIAVDNYRELIRFFGDNDPTTRVMIECILALEEELAFTKAARVSPAMVIPGCPATAQ